MSAIRPAEPHERPNWAVPGQKVRPKRNRGNWFKLDHFGVEGAIMEGPTKDGIYTIKEVQIEVIPNWGSVLGLVLEEFPQLTRKDGTPEGFDASSFEPVEVN